MAKPLCIYHGNCADGFGAAWVIWKHFKGDVDFYPGVYQRPPPDVTNREVILVDFSYKRPVLLEMGKKARTMLILDHHKTAMDDLESREDEPIYSHTVPKTACFEEFLSSSLDEPHGIFSVFDMDRSGAGIAWDFFNPGIPRPKLIDHIEDRDLWRFKLFGTRSIQAALFSYPYNFQEWDRLMHPSQLDALQSDGEAIERKHFKDIHELIEVATRPMKFQVPVEGTDTTATATVPVANVPYTMGSDAAHILCERDLYGKALEAGMISHTHTEEDFKHPFAGYYWDGPNGRQFGLRSREGGEDVGEIAKLYGGGGHARASGFLVPYSRIEEFEV